jgi:fucose permease
MSSLQAMMIAALLISGMGAALLGSVKVPLARKLQIDEARVGGLVSIFGFTMIPVIPLAGVFTDLIGPGGVLITGCGLLAGSLLGLAWCTKYSQALVMVVLLSAGWSLVINAGNVLTPVTFTGDPAFATNLANVFFGLGAFLTPLTIAFLVRYLSLFQTLVVVGIVPVVPAALSLGIDFGALMAPAPTAAATAPTAAWTSLLGDRGLWLCALALFFYGPLEASMAAWATTYLGGRGLSEQTAAGFLSAFWLTFMAARLITAFSLPPGYEATFILVLALASTAVLIGVVVSRHRLTAAATVLAAGFVFGPIFPTVLAILLDHFDKSLLGRAVGLFFAIGAIGWTAIPALIGARARRGGVQSGFVIAVLAAAGLCGIAVFLVASG